VEYADVVEKGTMLEADEVRAAQERQYGTDCAGIEGKTSPWTRMVSGAERLGKTT
jgi:hypothetical protein